jgi:glycolate oxidase iron-sulfur subunit
MKNSTRPEQTKKFLEDLKRCIDCGNCTLWCPIYEEEPVESSVARGKHKMIRALLAGEADYSEEFATLLSKCTLCMACTAHCPFQSQVQSTIIASRADRVKAEGIGLSSRFVYRWLIPHRWLFGNVVGIASWLQWIFLHRTDARIRHLPLFLSGLGKGRQIPAIASKFLRELVPVVNRPPEGVKTKMRVGYFIGCATDFVFPHVGQKTIDFLSRHGVEVIVPKEQGCCGAPVWLGVGDFDTGRKLADTTIKAFAGMDYVLADCATCSSALREYPKFLADTTERNNSYKGFAGKVKDVSEFLVDILKLPESAYLPSAEVKGKKITWHDPCHAIRYLGVKDQPRKIIRSIPDVELIEMIGADRCCGMAGAFSLHYYELSKRIADKKAQKIRETGADIVATACPGCMIQLTDTAKRNKMPQQVMHIMQLLQ